MADLSPQSLLNSALCEFAVAHADQNDADFAAFVAAIEAGEIASAERP